MKPTFRDRVFRAVDYFSAMVITVTVFAWWFVVHCWRGPETPEDDR